MVSNKFKRIVDIMVEEEVYALTAAMRGPDIDGLYYVKTLLTGQLRALLFDAGSWIHRYPPVMCLLSEKSETDMLYEAITSILLEKKNPGFTKTMTHYLGHIRMALNVLQVRLDSLSAIIPELTQEKLSSLLDIVDKLEKA